jgi:hypothetical protein
MPAPGTPEFLAEKEAKRKAAEAWLRENVQIALVIPRAVARDLFPSGYGEVEWNKILPEVMPGEVVDGVEIGVNNTFVMLKRG